MHSMTQKDTMVVAGVDSHADAHYVAALDERGAVLSTKSFPTTTPGYQGLLDWLSGFGEIDVVAVESTGSYAAAAARHSAVKSRSAALVQLRDVIITAPQELRDQLSDRKTLRGKATVCARFRPSTRELRSDPIAHPWLARRSSVVVAPGGPPFPTA